MFGALTEKFHSLFSGLAGKKQLTEENIASAVRDVRLALLDADVNYTVASQFVKRVKEKALGDDVLKSVKPGEQFVEVVHQELIDLMGVETAQIRFKGSPTVILMCGLQGSGKTTQTAKLANHFKGKEHQKRVMVAACDLQRPAAVEQLQRLCSGIDVPVFTLEGKNSPVKVAKEALATAKKEGYDLLIVDTAGRLHIDEELMDELAQIKKVIEPHEVLFVASAATGQDAVKTAQEFDQKIGITGSILTMLDGSARAGAAISIREVTQKPLLFEGVGEKIDDLQPFNPESMADRVLGMGDVINLVRKAKEHLGDDEEKELEKKMRKASFTYEDYLKQMKMVRRMGSFKSLFKMMPGVGNMPEIEQSDEEFGKMEAMILSMTPDERSEKVELIPPRRWRVAKGSGTTVDEVNRMVKGFKKLRSMMKQMNKGKINLEKMLCR